MDRTEDGIRAAVASRGWFHSINLGHGIVTPGLDDSTAKLAGLGLPEDLSGKSVLDIGAWDGFFSFECERRGAAVLATDYLCWTGVGIQNGGGFEIAHAALNSKIRKKLIRVEDLPDGEFGTFDIVLFLGVLYHATDPLGYLRTVRMLTKGMAVIETHVDLLDVPKPALAYYPGGTLGGDGSNFFGPNEAAVHGMCHDAGFSRTETVRPIYAPTRMVFHAYA